MTEARPEMPDGIEDRNADVWESRLAIADAAGEDWAKRARAAAVSLVSAGKEAEPSLGIRLLADCRTVFVADLMPTAALLRALHELPESPRSDLKGKPLNDRGLALQLRKYDIKSKQIRIGEVTLKGYDRTDFVDVWQRYLPSPSDGSETSETSETSREFQGLSVSPVSDTPSNVSDGVSDGSSGRAVRNADETELVSDVSDVSLVRGEDGTKRSSEMKAAEILVAVQKVGQPCGSKATPWWHPMPAVLPQLFAA
jgi:hypothetical protein